LNLIISNRILLLGHLDRVGCSRLGPVRIVLTFTVKTNENVEVPDCVVLLL
jgi:hypothetical protein